MNVDSSNAEPKGAEIAAGILIDLSNTSASETDEDMCSDRVKMLKPYKMRFSSPSGWRAAKVFRKLLNKEFDHKVLSHTSRNPGGWFLSSVDPVTAGCPDYFDIIKQPMDFGTIQSNLEGNKYGSDEQVAVDIRLTLNNAILYNQDPNHPIRMRAEQLLRYFEEQLLQDGGHSSSKQNIGSEDGETHGEKEHKKSKNKKKRKLLWTWTEGKAQQEPQQQQQQREQRKKRKTSKQQAQTAVELDQEVELLTQVRDALGKDVTLLQQTKEELLKSVTVAVAVPTLEMKNSNNNNKTPFEELRSTASTLKEQAEILRNDEQRMQDARAAFGKRQDERLVAFQQMLQQKGDQFQTQEQVRRDALEIRKAQWQREQHEFDSQLKTLQQVAQGIV